MRMTLGTRWCHDALSQYLNPQVWKQAHQVWHPEITPSRWTLGPLVWTLVRMVWGTGDSQEERFATARAAQVGAHRHDRQPGATLAGFLEALGRLPMVVLRTLAAGVRRQVGERYLAPLRLHGWLPVACDGTRLECPRAQQLQERLGEAGKPASAPTLYLTTLVLLPFALLWSWRLGKGTASESQHLRQLLPTLPPRSLLVADAGFLGYDLFQAIVQAGQAFLVRLSSRAYLYTENHVPLERFGEGLVYYWPGEVQRKGRPPLRARLLRVRGRGGDVWLLTNLLERPLLSRRSAAQIYRWRWRNEGLFRVYKCQLGKMKLQSRTVALVHREAEGSRLALQLLMALTADAAHGRRRGGQGLGSPRQMLLLLRGDILAWVRSLGPRQFEHYLQRLAIVRCEERVRLSAKTRQDWPRRKQHKPPKPPKLRVLDKRLKQKMAKVLQAA